MSCTDWIEDLDAGEALDAVERVHGQLVAAEAAQFALAAHWAVLHNQDVVNGGRRPLPGMEQARRLGGAGTPLVVEFAAAELAAALGVSPVTGSCLIRDALDVRHRHPLLWEAVMAGRVRVWQARKVAQACHAAQLTAAQARLVDAETTPRLGSMPWSRFETMLAGGSWWTRRRPSGGGRRRRRTGSWPPARATSTG